MHAIFEPTRLLGPLEDLFIVDAAAGEEMSVFVGQGKTKGGKIFEQVYSCGNNLKGSLGINRPSHLQDLTLVGDLSNLHGDDGEALTITNIACGRRHCMAAFDYGACHYWGDNHVGQLGNRKRSYMESPYRNRKFENKEIANIILDHDSSCVIVEDHGRIKKKKKKNKKILRPDEVVRSPDELKRKAEALIQKDPNSQDVRGRKGIFERAREATQNLVYGKEEPAQKISSAL